MEMGKIAAAGAAALIVASAGAGEATFTSSLRSVVATGAGDAGQGCTTATSQQSNPFFGPWQIGVAPPAFAAGSATQVSAVTPDSVVFGAGEATIASTPACPRPSVAGSHVDVQVQVTGTIVARLVGTLDASEIGAGSATAGVCILRVGEGCIYSSEVSSDAAGARSLALDETLELSAGTYHVVFAATASADDVGSPNLCTAAFDLAATFFPVVNDDCADAEPLEVDFIALFDTTYATNDGPPQETCLAGVGAITVVNDVWFRHDSVCDASLIISLCGLTDFDTVLAVYDGCPDRGGALLACNDDAPNCPGFTSQVIVPAFAGRTYLIRVGGVAGAPAGSSGFGGIVMTCEVPNDYCVDSLPVGIGTTGFSTIGATTDGPPLDGECGGARAIDEDIWFRTIAACSGIAHVAVCGDFDARVAVYAGGCPEDGTAQLACGDSSPRCDAGAEASFEVVAGATYRIRVGGVAGRPGHGELTLEVACRGCLGDLGGDGVVDGGDLGVLLGAWGATGSPADLNGDDSVDGSDLGIMLGAWGPCP